MGLCYFNMVSVLLAISINLSSSIPRSNAPEKANFRIVNGIEVSGKHKAPWMVFISIAKSELDIATGLVCGGVLLSSRLVLTSTHCLSSVKSPDEIKLIIGYHNYLDGLSDDVITALNYTINPKFNNKTYEYDMALIHLSDDVQESENIRYAKILPQAYMKLGLDILANKVAYIYGWGTDTDDSDYGPAEPSEDLHLGIVKILSNEDCEWKLRIAYTKYFPESQLCVDTFKGAQGLCTHDFGGPLMIKFRREPNVFYLVGVMSFAFGCDTPIPNVISRINNQFVLDWIAEHGGPSQ